MCLTNAALECVVGEQCLAGRKELLSIMAKIMAHELPINWGGYNAKG